MTPLQLNTRELLDTFWPQVEPLLRRSVHEANHGEFTFDDLKLLIVNQKAFVFVVTNDVTGQAENLEVPLALVVEPLYYPQLPSLNVLAMGGRGVRKYGKMFWKHFAGWAFISGFKSIEGRVSPGVARIAGPIGFKPVYTQIRYDLGGTDA